MAPLKSDTSQFPPWMSSFLETLDVIIFFRNPGCHPPGCHHS